MSAQHSPEPWVPWDEAAFLAGASQEASVTHESEQFDSDEPTYTVPEADYLRAVECVNACAGINPKAVPGMLEALRAAEPYLYNAPLEGALDVHAKVRAAIDKAEGQGA